MKILHLSSEKNWRGGEQQIDYLLQELNRQNIENVVACRTGSALETYCSKQGWPFFTLPFKGSFDLFTAIRIKQILKKERIDLVHVHSAQAQSLAIIAYMLGGKVPLILSRRVAFPIRHNIFTQWKYNHTAITKIICVSNAVEQIVRSSIKKPNRCLTVYSGIDISRHQQNSAGLLRKDYKLDHNILLAGNISALDTSKDPFTFVDTADYFRQYSIPIRFFLIGDGPEREAIENYIASKDLQNHVMLTGYKSNIIEILPELDFFLMTSQTEGLGTSILDAFACKVPVIATRAGGIPEMVIHQKTGLLADVKDAAQLAQHLKMLIDDPGLKARLVENAYQHLLHNFTKEQMASKTLEVYREVMQNKKPGE